MYLWIKDEERETKGQQERKELCTNLQIPTCIEGYEPRRGFRGKSGIKKIEVLPAPRILILDTVPGSLVQWHNWWGGNKWGATWSPERWDWTNAPSTFFFIFTGIRPYRFSIAYPIRRYRYIRNRRQTEGEEYLKQRSPRSQRISYNTVHFLGDGWISTTHDPGLT